MAQLHTTLHRSLHGRGVPSTNGRQGKDGRALCLSPFSQVLLEIIVPKGKNQTYSPKSFFAEPPSQSFHSLTEYTSCYMEKLCHTTISPRPQLEQYQMGSEKGA